MMTTQDTVFPRSRRPGGWRDRLLAAALKLPFVRYAWLYRLYLRSSGWAASARANAPVDGDEHPIPWYTYPALAFLEPRLRNDMEVFEYGAGHSTLWWAARVGHVCSVESDAKWIGRLRSRLPINTELRHEALNNGYAHSALHRGRRFDLIVIDGYERNDCARAATSALKDDGVIIWDNAEREQEYADGFAHLGGLGFRRLDFDGMGPLNGYGWRTSFFYRPGANCLGL
jgi:precorrin-6B methylase 2